MFRELLFGLAQGQISRQLPLKLVLKAWPEQLNGQAQGRNLPRDAPQLLLSFDICRNRFARALPFCLTSQ